MSSVLGAFGTYDGVFVEITRMDHTHGGPGWEFGACLWSPSTNKAGHDRYALMRKPAKGDLVLHFLHDRWSDQRVETRLCGRSHVAGPCREVREQPPSPGAWAGFDSYFRIDLADFQPFPAPVPLRTIVETYADSIRREIRIAKPNYYPFTTHGSGIRTVQGIYLARCTQELFGIFTAALGIQQDAPDPSSAGEGHESYSEGRRISAERLFFARNLKLVFAAKARYGSACMVCGFDFGRVYGELGEGYIEAHHLDPLSERDESEWTEELRTAVDRVAVVCANCHRMIHRRRPALSLAGVRASLI